MTQATPNVENYRSWIMLALADSCLAELVLALDVAAAGDGIAVRVKLDVGPEDQQRGMDVANAACGGFGTGNVTVVARDGSVLAGFDQIVTP